MIYKNVYSFMVDDEVAKGEMIYCLDREEKEVFTVNSCTYEEALSLLRDAKDNERYEFWKEIKENDG